MRSVPISSELRSLLLEIRQHSQSEFILSRFELWRSGVEPVKVMKICGWKDLKTLAIYLRLAGVDEKGATEELSFLPQLNDNILSLHS